MQVGRSCGKDQAGDEERYEASVQRHIERGLRSDANCHREDADQRAEQSKALHAQGERAAPDRSRQASQPAKDEHDPDDGLRHHGCTMLIALSQEPGMDERRGQKAQSLEQQE